jgi:hypothetical protein
VRVDCAVTVVIDLDPALGPDVITRCTENIDGWRDSYYDFTTPELVYEHLAYNCVANGVHDVSRLDGWADVPEDACRMFIEPYSFESMVQPERTQP